MEGHATPEDAVRMLTNAKPPFEPCTVTCARQDDGSRHPLGRGNFFDAPPDVVAEAQRPGAAV
jgi:hypothetical protein